ncbi:MAG: C-GCAxxG-C-C family protein [Coriobacteriia bacterium]|nr:C-GCAxxG-C-C family protein [Coriobacteriia bacterium]
MTVLSEKAAIAFTHGFNCAQSVFTAFSGKYGLDSSIAARIATGLGAGVRSGEICGAVNGAALVIGLKYGQAEQADQESKPICNSKTVEYLNSFKQANGSIVCRELLECDVSTDAGRSKAESENLFTTICVDFVKSAVELLEELGY